jgi:K+:H+ antiporter
MNDPLLFAVQSIVIIVLPYALSRIGPVRRTIPLVVVQIFVGVVLGPSVLGKLAPGIYSAVFNPGRLEALSGIASIAVVLFGFVTGLHLRPEHYRYRDRTFAWMAAGSLLVPLAFGTVAGLIVLARMPDALGPRGHELQFVAAVAISVSVTALPVLGSLLHEMQLLATRLGQVALGLAAVNDGVLWLLLAVLLGAGAADPARTLSVVATLIGLALYVAAMVFVVARFLNHVMSRESTGEHVSDDSLIVAISAALLSAMVTEMLGLHSIFGAFMAGVVMPQAVREKVLRKIESTILLVFMPFFFVLGGLRVAVDIDAFRFIGASAIFFFAAMAGKIIGIAVTGWSTSVSRAENLALGVLMSTKGLMEVVVLTILLEAGMISASIFSALMLMGLVINGLVAPLTRGILSVGARREDARNRLGDPRPAE